MKGTASDVTVLPVALLTSLLKWLRYIQLVQIERAVRGYTRTVTSSQVPKLLTGNLVRLKYLYLSMGPHE